MICIGPTAKVETFCFAIISMLIALTQLNQPLKFKNTRICSLKVNERKLNDKGKKWKSETSAIYTAKNPVPIVTYAAQ